MQPSHLSKQSMVPIHPFQLLCYHLSDPQDIPVPQVLPLPHGKSQMLPQDGPTW